MKDFAAVAGEMAREMARELNRLGTDPNEVSSALATLREQENGRQFFRFLDTVVREGQAVVRSGRTLDYYRQILKVCREHLTPYQDDPEKMAYILGWTARLMRYYGVESKSDRGARPPKAARQQRAPRPTAEGNRRTGTVKWFNTDKRFGFVQPDGGGDDLFVHISQTPGQQGLQENQRVSFIVGKGQDGRPQAHDVQPN